MSHDKLDDAIDETKKAADDEILEDKPEDIPQESELEAVNAKGPQEPAAPAMAPEPPAPTLAPEPIAPPVAQMPAQAPMAPAPAMPPQAAAPLAGPQANQVDVQAKPQTSAILKPISVEELQNDHGKLTQDLANGHITPETYSTLFAKKDTLGKIGTIFGLMLSGAGSGLTGTPNALLEMMNKTISNDLEAQKNSASNAQNLLRINQQDQMNRSDMGYKLAEIEKMKKDGVLTEAQAKLAKADADIKVKLQSRMDADRIAVHDLAQRVNNLPVGSPDRIKGEQLLGDMNSMLQDQHFDIMSRAASMSAFMHSAAAQSETGKEENRDNATGINIDRMSELIKQGKKFPDKPGVIPPAEVEHVQKEAEDAETNRALAKAYDYAYKELNTVGAGKFTPTKRKALIATLGTIIAKETAGRYNQAEAEAQAEGIFPSGMDSLSPGTRKLKYETFMKSLKAKENSYISLRRYGLLNKFPDYKYGKSGDQKGSSAVVNSDKSAKTGTVERKLADGRTALFDPTTKKFLRYKGDTSTIASEK